MAIQNGSATSSGSFPTLTVSGRNENSGTITWTAPSLPSTATITSTSLTFTLTRTMSKGNATVTVNGTTYEPGTYTIDLGTSIRTSVTVTGKGNNNNANGTVSISGITYTVNYQYDDGAAPETFTVTFVDYDGTVLKTEEVVWGGSATPPTPPTHANMTFSSWSGSYTNVQSDVTVTAVYTSSATYTVTFLAYHGAPLKTEQVRHGSSATPPTPPTYDDMIFTHWDGSYTNVQSNTTVKAHYVYDQGVSSDNILPSFFEGDWYTHDKLSIVGTLPHTIVFSSTQYAGFNYLIPEEWKGKTITIIATDLSPNMRICIWDDTNGRMIDYTDINDYQPGYSLTIPYDDYGETETMVVLQVTDTNVAWVENLEIIFGILEPEPDPDPEPEPTVSKTIIIDGSNVVKLLMGDTGINKIYIGSQLVWSTAAANNKVTVNGLHQGTHFNLFYAIDSRDIKTGDEIEVTWEYSNIQGNITDFNTSASFFANSYADAVRTNTATGVAGEQYINQTGDINKGSSYMFIELITKPDYYNYPYFLAMTSFVATPDIMPITWTIDSVKVTVNGSEVPILGAGGFFTDESITVDYKF